MPYEQNTCSLMPRSNKGRAGHYAAPGQMGVDCECPVVFTLMFYYRLQAVRSPCAQQPVTLPCAVQVQVLCTSLLSCVRVKKGWC